MDEWRKIQRAFVWHRADAWDAMVLAGCSTEQIRAAIRHLYRGVHPSRLLYLAEPARDAVLSAITGR